ncbi:hypothetical protein [Hahella ganghwensis]|uniref:hypothetical protein n=1 Tax=Hahella ganghwensis TaxID=286420 RepID=UPI000381FB16|nr:hypothetical protein [Hahella ganghwensis]
MEFDKEKYKVWKLPHPMLLHWIINPGLAFNELILGQRIPKVTLIDKTSDAPLMERQYIPCPECSALNDSRLWSKSNSFGHWFGYVCPECHGRIPCLWNITSLIFLALTFPIWIWLKIFGEEKWLEKEKGRFAEVVETELPEAKKTNWLKMGITYGVLMFCIMVLPKIVQNQLTPSAIAIQVAIWLGGGLVFGLAMKLFLGSRK